MSRSPIAGLPAAPVAGGAELLRLPLRPRLERLANGLTVCVLASDRVPLAVTALWYRAGARHEPAGQEGVAHFLEHMMFRGSPGFGAGEVDAVSLAAGGSNNAFTTPDATVYYFSFASDRWRLALDMECDRMAALDLDPAAVELERAVILEELAMYRDQPWDALEMEVARALFGNHPYGRPVVGERAAIERLGVAELTAFHRRHYTPGNAVLVLAGDVGEDAVEAARQRFERLPARALAPSPEPTSPPAPAGRIRVERRRGEVDRLLVALPAPPADHPDHPLLQTLTTLLAGGRSSRLYRSLVDRERLCSWVDAGIGDSVGPGMLMLMAEALPGADRDAIERRIVATLAELRHRPPSAPELERCRRILLAEWVFGTERVEQQAMIAGEAALLFDLEQPERQARRAFGASAEELQRTAARYLDPERSSVVGWSLAEET